MKLIANYLLYETCRLETVPRTNNRTSSVVCGLKVCNFRRPQIIDQRETEVQPSVCRELVPSVILLYQASGIVYEIWLIGFDLCPDRAEYVLSLTNLISCFWSSSMSKVFILPVHVAFLGPTVICQIDFFYLTMNHVWLMVLKPISRFSLRLSDIRFWTILHGILPTTFTFSSLSILSLRCKSKFFSRCWESKMCTL